MAARERAVHLAARAAPEPGAPEPGMVADGGEPTDDSDERTADGSAADEPRTDHSTTDEPTDEEIVAAASDAAEGVVFSRYRRSDVRDLDVTVGFDDGVLQVDVYLNVPDADVEERVDEEAEQVADDAALAAVDAVDQLFEQRGG